MDSIEFQQQINSLNSDVARYLQIIDTYTKLIYNVKYADTTTLSYEEMMRRMDYAERHLSYARKEIERIEQRYYSQFPLTQAQLEYVGFPSGITNLNGSDKY